MCVATIAFGAPITCPQAAAERAQRAAAVEQGLGTHTQNVSARLRFPRRTLKHFPSTDFVVRT